MTIRKVFAAGIIFLIVQLFYTGALAAEGAHRIVVNIAARTLYHYVDDALVKEYSIAVGKPSTPSPQGEYRVVEKIENPWWFPTTPGMDPVPSGPGNPLGYRWIGFAETYGIHGTNAPWSIGTSASKGCIRMHEEDVEELFAQIPVGTPVSVFYDTTRVTKDERGDVYVAIYEDIYERGTSTTTHVRQQLAAVGAEDLASDEEIKRIIRSENAKPQKIGRLVHIKINNSFLETKGILLNDMVYVPAGVFAQTAGVLLIKGNDGSSMTWQGKTIPAISRPGGMYVSLWALQDLLGAQCTFHEAYGIAGIELLQVYFNGKPMTVRPQMIDGDIALPLAALLEAAGLKKDAGLPGDPSVFIGGRKIPAVMYEGVAYLPISHIRDSLNMYVHYDEKARMVQLNYLSFIAGRP